MLKDKGESFVHVKNIIILFGSSSNDVGIEY